MKKIYHLDNWDLTEKSSNNKRMADVKIKLIYPYPDQKVLIALKPKERIKKIDQGFRDSLKRLLNLNMISEHEIIGTPKRPLGIHAKVELNNLEKLSDLEFIDSIWIESVDNAVKIIKENPSTEKYFCVKMTIIIEVESHKPKKHSTENRFVLIKALSFQDAYDKVEKQHSAYGQPYLNPAGLFVRWRIDSYDDCFETEIVRADDIDNPEGVEVFSELKSKKYKALPVWNGEF
ncbi:MAG TPA: DUF4288 domain-containing protein [Mucilaginibacter sp.]